MVWKSLSKASQPISYHRTKREGPLVSLSLCTDQVWLWSTKSNRIHKDIKTNIRQILMTLGCRRAGFKKNKVWLAIQDQSNRLKFKKIITMRLGRFKNFRDSHNHGSRTPISTLVPRLVSHLLGPSPRWISRRFRQNQSPIRWSLNLQTLILLTRIQPHRYELTGLTRRFLASK